MKTNTGLLMAAAISTLIVISIYAFVGASMLRALQNLGQLRDGRDTSRETIGVTARIHMFPCDTGR